MYRRNSDERLRKLERLWLESRDDRDLDYWLIELVRATQLQSHIEAMLPIWRTYATTNDYQSQTERSRLLRSLERIGQLNLVPSLDRWLWSYNLDDAVNVPDEPEAIRVVGDAIIKVSFIGGLFASSQWYSGRVGVPDGPDWVIWEFTDLGAPGGGWGVGIAYDSDYAFDEIAWSAFRHGSITDEDGDPDEDTADYIEEAVQFLYINEDGDELDSQEMIEQGRMTRIDIDRLEC